MRAEDYLSQIRQLPITTRAELTGDAPFVVLSPHPDDETLGAGGLIRQACMAGQRVDVVVLTDGAGSHTHSAMYPPARLVQLRKDEVLEAARILGLGAERLHHFDLPDAHAPTQGPAFEQAVAHIASLITRFGARTLFVTWHHDPHCDHKAASTIAAAVVEQLPEVKLWSFPIWGWHLDANHDLPDSPNGVRLNISGELDAKRHAIAAHRSQMTDLIADDPAGFRFTNDTLSPFVTPFEHFLS